MLCSKRLEARAASATASSPAARRRGLRRARRTLNVPRRSGDSSMVTARSPLPRSAREPSSPSSPSPKAAAARAATRPGRAARERSAARGSPAEREAAVCAAGSLEPEPESASESEFGGAAPSRRARCSASYTAESAS